jgi:ParB-like chromosome segregation protein Spo0J
MKDHEHFAPDFRVENWLKALGVAFRLVPVALEDIDEKASLRNQARKEPINLANKDSCVSALRNGDRLPALVLAKGAAEYVILGGNHRFAASKELGYDCVLAYVVDVNDDTVQRRIAKKLNVGEGMQLDSDERLQDALQDIRDEGITREEAAKRYQIGVGRIERAQRADEVKRRLAERHVRVPVGVPDSTLDYLAGVTNDNVLPEAVAVVRNSGLPAEEARQFVKRIKAKRTEGEQLAVVRQEAEKLGVLPVMNGVAEAEPRRPRNLKALQFRRALTQMLNLTHGRRSLVQRRAAGRSGGCTAGTPTGRGSR